VRTELGGIGVRLEVSGVSVGLAVARGLSLTAGSERIGGEIERAIREVLARPEAVIEARTKAVRDLLRHGKYKPTGRGKPASEYLLAAAREGRFPRINDLVDALNLVSLVHLLPISLIDLGRANTAEFAVRRGREGESYVFNVGGQVIELCDLLLVSALPEDRPLANPVKDSMAGKLGDSAEAVLGVVYAPPALAEEAGRCAADLAQALERAGAGAMSAKGLLSQAV
jgi:DNA/RNA-binding domain of Phe-tRNA-synthetase-like protein